MATTDTEIPVILSSASPNHTLTSSSPPSKHTGIAGIVGNQQEIARTQDPDTSVTQDVLCPIVEPHFNSDDEHTGSSSCSHGSSDPLTVNVTHQLEQVSKDHESTCAQADTIHTPPEEMATTATEIPVELSSVPPTHTLTSPPPSEHIVIAGIIRNQQEIARTQDPDPSNFETQVL